MFALAVFALLGDFLSLAGFQRHEWVQSNAFWINTANFQEANFKIKKLNIIAAKVA